jgi:Protein of unknown function (DUF559)/Transcriptional regulator, AbiEi antitoxin
MPELPGSAPEGWAQIHSVRMAGLAERQGGVAGREQLLRLGLSGTTISRWVVDGRLHRVHPGVYAVGHPVLGIRARLIAALLYAGAGAVLSHQTAAWHWRLLDVAPKRIHICTTSQVRSLAEIRIHHPRLIERATHDHLPVTTVARTLLDLAATMAFADLRRALAEADHLDLLDPAAVEAQLGRGRRGASALRKAFGLHWPDLAETRSVLEDRFLALVEDAGLPRPEVNPRVEGFIVDALWRNEKVVVELDGHAAHAKPAAIERDRRRDLVLRTAGFAVRRYTWEQVTRTPEAVLADVRATIAARRSGRRDDP